MDDFNGKFHFSFCLLVWCMIVLATNVWINPIFMFFGTMFPDADHRRAPMGRFIPLWLLFKHRGFTHTFYGMILFSLPFAYWNWKWSIYFMSGYFLHLALDAGTPSGIRWFTIKRKKRAI